MKRLLVALTACLAFVGAAIGQEVAKELPGFAPTCLPSTYGGQGSELKTGESQNGHWFFWTCTRQDGAIFMTARAVMPDYRVESPVKLLALLNTFPNKLDGVKQLWTSMTVAPSNIAQWNALVDDATADMAAYWATIEPPLSTHIVRSNGTYTTRPAYLVVNGVRQRTEADRAPILTNNLPTPCDCSTNAIVETSLTGVVTRYCPWLTTDPNLVVVCVAR